MTRPRIYIAGPEVFLPDAHARAAEMKRICAAAGLDGVFPLDEPCRPQPEWAALGEAARIYAQNEAHIRACQGVIANITPFRGVSADAGTLFEIGFARGLGLPVFAWSNVAADYTARCVASGAGALEPGGALRDADGLAVEAFGLAENLMVTEAVAASGGVLIARDVAPGAIWTDLGTFEAVVGLVALRGS